MAGILDYKRFLDLNQTTEDVKHIFPRDQYKYTYDFAGLGADGWSSTATWMTLIVDKINFSSTGEPNFSNSNTLGYFIGGSANQGSSGTITFPANMYTGPILPGFERNIPITVINITWTKGSQQVQKQLLLIQNWEPGTDPADPALDPDFIPLATSEISVTHLLSPVRLYATGTTVSLTANAINTSTNTGTGISNTLTLRLLPSSAVDPSYQPYTEITTSTLIKTQFVNGFTTGSFTVTNNFVDTVLIPGTGGSIFSVSTSTLTTSSYSFTALVTRTHAVRLEWQFDESTRYRGGHSTTTFITVSTSRSFVIQGQPLGITLSQDTAYQRVNNISNFTVSHNKGVAVSGNVTLNAVFTPYASTSTSTVFIGTTTFNSSGIATIGTEFFNTGTYVIQAYYAGNLGSSYYAPQYVAEYSNTVSQIVQIGVPLTLAELVIEEKTTEDILHVHAVDNGITTGTLSGTVTFYKNGSSIGTSTFTRHTFEQQNPEQYNFFKINPTGFTTLRFNTTIPMATFEYDRTNTVGIVNLTRPGVLPDLLDNGTYGQISASGSAFGGSAGITLREFIATIEGVHYFKLDNVLRPPDTIYARNDSLKKYGSRAWLQGTSYDVTSNILYDLLRGAENTPFLLGINKYPLWTDYSTSTIESQSHIASLSRPRGDTTTGTFTAFYSGSTSTQEFVGYYPETLSVITATNVTFTNSQPYLSVTSTNFVIYPTSANFYAINTSTGEPYSVYQTQYNIQYPNNSTITNTTILTLSVDYNSGSTGTGVTLRGHVGETITPYYKRLGRLASRTKQGTVTFKNKSTLQEISTASLTATVTATTLSRDITTELPLAPWNAGVIRDTWPRQVHLPTFLREESYPYITTASNIATLADLNVTSLTTSTTSTVAISVAGYFSGLISSTVELNNGEYNLKYEPRYLATFNASNHAETLIFNAALTLPAANLQLNLDHGFTLPIVNYPGIEKIWQPTSNVIPPYTGVVKYFYSSYRIEKWTSDGSTLVETKFINFDPSIPIEGLTRGVTVTGRLGRVYSSLDASVDFTNSGTCVIKIYQQIDGSTGMILRNNSSMIHNIKSILLTSQTGANKFDLTTLYSQTY